MLAKRGQIGHGGVEFALVLCVSLTACAPGDSASTDRGGAAGTVVTAAGARAADVGAAGQSSRATPTVGNVAGGGAVPPANVPPGAPAPGSPSPSTTPPGMAGTAAPPAMPGGVAGAPAPPSTGTSTAPAGDICARWKADRVNIMEGPWNGDAASCMAGDMTADARATAYRLHTLYRFMVGLEPVPMTDDNNAKAQACSLLMTANGMISHTPDMSWKCYTADAAKIANSSSLSGGGAVAAVDGYMVDPGNPTTLGHRRWILSNMLVGVGFGSSGKFSCQYQPAGRGKSTKPWIAWPPPGQYPIQANGNRYSSVDQTGWSLQSDSVNLKSAQVTITANGMNMPVTLTQLGSGYGSTYAMSMIPMGWKATVGTTYNVNVTGASMPITYDVTVVDCK